MDAVATTRRLILRRASYDDIGALVPLGTEEVVRYTGGEPWTAESTRDLIDLWSSIESLRAVTTWLVQLRETKEIVGHCGFAGTIAPWIRPEFVIEIGWTLGSRWWGQGLATEAALAALDVGLRHYPGHRILSKCHRENVASERVMRRIGMRHVGTVVGVVHSPTTVYRFPA